MKISKQNETNKRVVILELKPQWSKLKTTLGSFANWLDHTEEKDSNKRQDWRKTTLRPQYRRINRELIKQTNT